jgi:hypothetical protein
MGGYAGAAAACGWLLLRFALMQAIPKPCTQGACWEQECTPPALKQAVSADSNYSSALHTLSPHISFSLHFSHSLSFGLDYLNPHTLSPLFTLYRLEVLYTVPFILAPVSHAFV